jgi:hypothetical protein
VEDFIKRYSNEWDETPLDLMNDYKYQPQLTGKLDGMDAKDFDQVALLEIVLWKLNRFPYLDSALINDLKSVAMLKPTEHRHAEALLHRLLGSSGVRLPVASTILRFLNPNTFQIIDDRTYRLLHPGAKLYPSKPAKGKSFKGYLTRSTDIYFRYLETLHTLSSEKLPFNLADRILYQLDRKLGNKIGDRL